jgi:hypothetical protein
MMFFTEMHFSCRTALPDVNTALMPKDSWLGLFYELMVLVKYNCLQVVQPTDLYWRDAESMSASA